MSWDIKDDLLGASLTKKKLGIVSLTLYVARKPTASAAVVGQSEHPNKHADRSAFPASDIQLGAPLEVIYDQDVHYAQRNGHKHD